MIYTVTLNPSLDYVMDVPTLQLGTVNRCESQVLVPGGKGINVSLMLEQLGQRTVALGFLGGLIGEEIQARLSCDSQVTTDFIKLPQGNSRINVKLRHKEQTEINGQGPQVSEDSMKALQGQIESLNKGDVLVLSGAISGKMSSSVYQSLMKCCKSEKIVVDATGEMLLHALEEKPWLVKPNREELEALFQVQIEGKRGVSKYAHILQEKGAKNVLVSLGAQGAYFLDEQGQSYFAKVPEGTAINPVGAGDAMIAGFIAGYIESKYDTLSAFSYGVASGSATAYTQRFATMEQVKAVLSDVTVQKNTATHG